MEMEAHRGQSLSHFFLFSAKTDKWGLIALYLTHTYQATNKHNKTYYICERVNRPSNADFEWSMYCHKTTYHSFTERYSIEYWILYILYILTNIFISYFVINCQERQFSPFTLYLIKQEFKYRFYNIYHFVGALVDMTPLVSGLNRYPFLRPNPISII